MEKQILRVLGDIAAIQTKYNLNKWDNTMLGHLLKTGTFSVSEDLDSCKYFEELSRSCRACGLEVKIEDTRIIDPTSYHKTEYLQAKKLTISLPVSPALEVLYAKSNSK